MTAEGSVQPRRGVTPYQPREGAPVFLSDMIIELGLAEAEHVEAAVDTARSSGETVGRILVREGRLTEDQLARALAARYGLNHIDLNEFEVDPDAANLLPPAAAERYKAVPVAFEPNGGLLVAMADPSDSLAISDIAFMTRLEVQAAVAAGDLIAVLVASLPLPPNESRGPAFQESAFGAPHVGPASLDQPPAAYPPAPEHPPAPPDPASRIPDPGSTPPPAPAVDAGELAALRAELEQSHALLDTERSKHAQMVAELRQQVSGEETLRAQAEDARRELDAARHELDGARHELDQMRGELDHTRGERDRARETASRAAEAESRLSELSDAEHRIAEAHATLEKMRNEFELERETHAANERDLRARLASETERHEALQEAQGALQKRVEVLRTQNAALLDAYATAKRWSAEFARGARELAATLEQPVLDDAVRSQQVPPPQDKPADDDETRESGRFTREDDEQPPEGGGGATPPTDWFS